MKFKGLFFDFDGTLADTAPAIIAVQQRTLKEFGFPIPTEDEIKQVIGLPLEQCCMILGKTDEQTAAKMCLFYRDIFDDYVSDYTTIYPGVKETLKTLKDEGFRLAICTSRSAPSLDVILRTHGLDDLFETRVTAADGLDPKPAPAMVNALLERMSLSSDEVLVTGDTTFDIGMGNSAHCHTCAVTYGNHSLDKLMTASPSWTIDSFPDILNLVR